MKDDINTVRRALADAKQTAVVREDGLIAADSTGAGVYDFDRKRGVIQGDIINGGAAIRAFERLVERLNALPPMPEEEPQHECMCHLMRGETCAYCNEQLAQEGE
ncbi:hypothetical protein HBA54_19215 [Pelagibius litoralis]|uniref:Uncharacterized protein n=1 Tax=Pelagibius litoralis TaxID=374515 RepID=A0A967F0G0_9PROT|nr:hypothetical protein [Pelagibius litoralis]NIA70733.1 hypothetical protein [Pelagibius litoralis]